MPREGGAGGVKSAVRVFEILELFDQVRIPLTVSDIARELDYPVSSALMLLRCMQDQGYLTLDEHRKTYMPTPRLSRITGWVDYSATGVKDLNGMLEDLQRSTGETIVLAAQQGIDAVFLRILRSHQPVSLAVQEGSWATLEESSVGLAILSAKTDGELDALLARINKDPERALSLSARQDLLKRVAKVRAKGVSCGYGYMSPDTGGIAAPLPVGPSGVLYVISVGGPKDRIKSREKEIVAALKDAVVQIEKQRDAAA